MPSRLLLLPDHDADPLVRTVLAAERAAGRREPDPLPFGLLDPPWYYLFDLVAAASEAGLADRNGVPFTAMLSYRAGSGENASCRAAGEAHLVEIGGGMLDRFLAAAGAVVAILPRIPQMDLDRDPVRAGTPLDRLVAQDTAPDPGLVAATRAGLPDLDSVGRTIDASAWLFHDMIRLVWLHELAHGICGHARFLAGKGHLDRLDEFDEARGGPGLAGLLRACELQADVFAARVSAEQILDGADMMATILGPWDDLAERLSWLRLAAALVSVLWTERERRSGGIAPSHPPSALRYYNFCSVMDSLGFGRDLDMMRAAAWVENAIRALTIECRAFFELQRAASFLFRTPMVKSLSEEEAALRAQMAPFAGAILAHAYLAEDPRWLPAPVGLTREARLVLTAHRQASLRATIAARQGGKE